MNGLDWTLRMAKIRCPPPASSLQSSDPFVCYAYHIVGTGTKVCTVLTGLGKLDRFGQSKLFGNVERCGNIPLAREALSHRRRTIPLLYDLCDLRVVLGSPFA